jgi:hypothetical protein
MSLQRLGIYCALLATAACEPTGLFGGNQAAKGPDASSSEGTPGGTGGSGNAGSGGPTGMASGAAQGSAEAGAPSSRDGATSLGGGAPATGSDAGSSTADSAASSAGADGSTQVPDWAGLVTLDASVTKAPDGAVVDLNAEVDAGPVLNAGAHSACLTLADNICNRIADCQVSLLQLMPSQRTQLYESCRRDFLRNHNCNRATRTADGFNACAESVKTRQCTSILADDFAVSCLDQITLEP